jgi:hypothetical protein
MALADEIRKLRDRALADLNAVHDYYTDTKLAWDIVDEYIAAGKTIAALNIVTGTQTTEAGLRGKAQLYVRHLAEATFQQFISIFEDFLIDLLRLWLQAYPQSLSNKTVTFEDILHAADKDAIISHVINRQLYAMGHDRPAEWFTYLEKLAKLGCPTQAEIERIAEAKASRDLLVHNRGVANETYEDKAGKLARCKDGDRIDIPEPYHLATWELIRKMVTDISDAASAKAP